MTPPLDELLALANAAADAVAATLADPDRTELGIDTKSSATDMVTVVDRWSERTIVECLLAARPDDGLLGEEGADKPSTTGVVWVIDPIDGTTNFIRDLPGFSVSIAARIDGIDSVGVVHDVVRNERFEATLGGGARCNGERLRVSSAADLGRAVIATGFNYQPPVRVEQATLLADLLPDIADIRRFGGAAVDCCSVAAGRLDAYYEVGVSDWDIAAGGLLIREAGGHTVDHRSVGGPFIGAGPAIFDELVGRVGHGV
ncbi:MAG: inositol monophosphatase family protein [Actinomycetota bacterium]